MGVRWAAVLLRLRAELRRRWPATVAVGIILGIAVGAAAAAAAGARRTAAAYAHLERSTNAADAQVVGGCFIDESEEQC